MPRTMEVCVVARRITQTRDICEAFAAAAAAGPPRPRTSRRLARVRPGRMRCM
jgi:hypothetical protein